MRRKATFLVTMWWLILLGVMGACMLLFANKEPSVSETENRTLAGIPSVTWQLLKDGEIDEAFERFLCDQFFLRSEIVDRAKAIKHLFSSLTVDELLDANDEEAFQTDTNEADEDTSEAVNTEATSGTASVQNDGENATTEQPGISAQSENMASVWLEQKNGTRTELLTYSKEQIQKAADVFNLYAALLPEGGTLHVLLTPRAQTVNKLALHLDTESGLSSDVERMLQSFVSKNVSVHSLYDILRNQLLQKEYVYFRTDHHWTARGAYFAADAMLKSEGIQTVPLSDYTKTQIEGYLGSIYLSERNAKLKELADTIEVFHPILPATGYSVTNAYMKNELPVIDETKNNYLVFLGGTHGPYRVLVGGYHTGRNMLLICDSFGNSIAPFFMPYYDDVYMVDFRDAYYSRKDAEAGVKEYIQRCGINDIYIVLSETNGIGSSYINRIMPANID
ncbi:MAG: DHHW family protein [Eubacteriales bacterium]|nr:DHHW family protein [Eubacteriales bacterium]